MEEQQTFLLPANSKRSQLIFGNFNVTDLIILGVGIAVSFMLLLALPVTEVWAVVVTLLPAGTAGILVFPVASYHNVRIFFREMINFYRGRRKYIWRGWCYKYEERE